MAVKIRLQRRGRRKRPFYHIVVADERAPRDGSFIEKLGTYNPMTKPATIELDRDRTFDWLMQGAQPTDTARAILKFKGVLYRKHLQRGVNRGALTQEQADQMYHDWIREKEAKITARRKDTAAEKAAQMEQLSGAIKPYVKEEVIDETDEAVEAGAEGATATEAPAVESEEASVQPEASSEETTDTGSAAAETPEASAKESTGEGAEASTQEEAEKATTPEEQPATETEAGSSEEE